MTDHETNDNNKHSKSLRTYFDYRHICVVNSRFLTDVASLFSETTYGITGIYVL